MSAKFKTKNQTYWRCTFVAGISALFAAPGATAQDVARLFCQIATEKNVRSDFSDNGACQGSANSLDVVINLHTTKMLWWQDGDAHSKPLGVSSSKYTLENWTAKYKNEPAVSAYINRISGRFDFSTSYMNTYCEYEVKTFGQCEPAGAPKF